MSEKLRLLIIEDVEDHALLVARELQKGGFDVFFERVETREELQAALDSGTWDAVISDYNVPGFSCIQALGMVQAKYDMPFVIVSGAIGEEVAAEMMRAGAHGYIRKGSYARLVPTMERELSQAAMRRERRRDAEELRRYRDHLEELVRERTSALQQSERRLTLALDAAAMCTWRFDPVTKECTWDERCNALFQLPQGLGMSYSGYLELVHPEDREGLEAAVSEVLADHRPYLPHCQTRPLGSVDHCTGRVFWR